MQQLDPASPTHPGLGGSKLAGQTRSCAIPALCSARERGGADRSKKFTKGAPCEPRTLDSKRFFQSPALYSFPVCSLTPAVAEQCAWESVQGLLLCPLSAAVPPLACKFSKGPDVGAGAALGAHGLGAAAADADPRATRRPRGISGRHQAPPADGPGRGRWITNRPWPDREVELRTAWTHRVQNTRSVQRSQHGLLASRHLILSGRARSLP
jgi:hypothetical protein